jgi:hypothetical protein
MEQVARAGRTVLFVSHGMGSIQALCQRALWFDHGKLRADSRSEEVVSAYILDSKTKDEVGTIASSLNNELIIKQVRLISAAGEEITEIESGQPMTVEVDYLAKIDIPGPYFWIGVVGHVGHLFTANMLMDGHQSANIRGHGQIRCHFANLPLMPMQSYKILMGAVEQDGYTILLPRTDLASFIVSGTPASVGFRGEAAEKAVRLSASIIVPYRWEMGDTPVDTLSKGTPNPLILSQVPG